MKKLMLTVIVALIAFSVVYSHGGVCNAADEMVVANEMVTAKDAACTNPDCTVENLCDGCKAKALSEACTNPDCTPENLCEMCVTALNAGKEAAE